ncbi:MAG: acyl-CoA dehydrogenase family protein [Ignavibacteria bacterium]|nr:acyl-CoA dehydrogenase family protein [Ignavibacteria bacterium]MBT8381322.1 acyl-CoA dehydrogenase family protein [Ignavibacteria bacterium]MBT8391695.1 acyl-CoA dehydrogenase family protein [Ignavibacteria bacterium]NNJ54237.1 acyl-CoA dehydrogenase [Ignavibacteriaceae bacterium]NNL22750.1 acyl-CoA dehydrogenase [Ignavibacteriaceae bacterium]
MDFTFSEDYKMLRELSRDFTNKEIKPLAQNIDEEERIPSELIKKIADLGFFGTSFPEKYGGGGFGKIGYCIMMEEIARGCSSTAAMIGAHQSIGTNAIFVGGSEELKRKYLPRLCSGEMIASFALTESEAGSDTFNLRTEAKKAGDKWILNGSKVWITNAGIANLLSVFARTEKGISAFAVEADSPGVIIGQPEKKLGIKGSVTNSITFENVEVPEENIIGREGRGFIIAMKTLDGGRLTIGACCLGASRELLELSTLYAKQRKQFGESISRFQAVQFMLAEMASKIYPMESIVYRCAYDYDQNKDVAVDAAIVKLYASEAMAEVADKALQVHGGMGFSRELPMERYYRDARILRIFEGTTEIQKMIIGRQIIKLNGKI